jgi:catechol 2,3-dioxygenase-like lactoylglutathione lyase family enzyme
VVQHGDVDERPALWVGHVVLASHDLNRSVQFYRSLGLRTFRDPGPDDVLIELEMRGGTHLVLVLDPGSKTQGRGAPFDLMVDDLEKTHASMRERGIEVSPIERPEGDHAFFTFHDPDGSVVTVNDSHVAGVV